MAAVETTQNLAEDALRSYGKRLEEARVLEPKTFVRPSFADLGPKIATAAATAPLADSSGDVLVELARDMTSSPAPVCEALDPADTVMLDGERVLLCKECRLPLGESAYAAKDEDFDMFSSGFLHADCKAQVMLRRSQQEEVVRNVADKALKQQRRDVFEIGWRPESIPSSTALAASIGCEAPPHGLCCLVAEEGDAGVRVAATTEPAAAVNLEYLAVALQVRRTEGREPLFSLDPVDNGKRDMLEPDSSMQQKRFEPEWLAGTSVGEVMFQADFHLKELSFGEYSQPVVGMKSCLDLSEMEDDEWSAREWFVVRKAEMHLSGDRVLVPHLKMGVEAREQTMGEDGLEDACITHPDHPLVRYADEFTHNFDLIAERKSVVFQLREVAKASIMAKYLLESGMSLPEAWYGSSAYEAKAVCCWEVPQLWNERHCEKVSVKDGALQPDSCVRSHGVYGGVDFGIDRFRLSAPSRVATSVVAGRAVLGRPATSLMASTRTGLAVGPARQFARLSAPMSATMSMAASRAGLGAPRVAAGLSMGAPQGVDLNLDKFNLSGTAEGGSWGDAVQAPDPAFAIGGKSFWAELEQGAILSAEDRELLLDVFHPRLSDRRADGELFVPPSASAQHMAKLRQLVKAERVLRARRQEHFFSAEFKIDKAGPLFPSDWIPSIAPLHASSEEELRPRPEYLAEQGLLAAFVQDFAPAFDHRAEDAARFRIYRFGSLEVRSVQEEGGAEKIGAVFSVGRKEVADVAKASRVEDADVVAKVTEYIERAPSSAEAARCRSYVVVETAKGDVISAEKPTWGPATWAENPHDLDRRNALAKAVRSRAARVGVTVGALKTFMKQGQLEAGCSTYRYAQTMFCAAAAQEFGDQASGFTTAYPQQVMRFTPGVSF